MNKEKYVPLLLLTVLAACANLNNATNGALTGGAIGGVIGAATGNVACSSSSCREVLLFGGVAVGALLGYKAGYEKDLELAKSLADELYAKGYSPVLNTVDVEVDVPIDKRTGKEVNELQALRVPDIHRGVGKKKIPRLQSLIVKMKKPGDKAEALEISKSFISAMKSGSDRPKLISMPVVNDEQRAIAKRYNVNLRRSANGNGSVVLTY